MTYLKWKSRRKSCGGGLWAFGKRILAEAVRTAHLKAIEKQIEKIVRAKLGSGVSDRRQALRNVAEDLERIFSKYGQLPGSRRLARAIVAQRDTSPLETAKDLIDLIAGLGIGRGRRHNPATLVFQALRIAVNDELGALEDGLLAAIRVLRPGGRLVVIAYHSLEDRIVKQTFRSAARGCVCPPDWPACQCGRLPTLEVLTRRPIAASDDEIKRNPRARSARLRAGIRLEAA